MINTERIFLNEINLEEIINLIYEEQIDLLLTEHLNSNDTADIA